MASDDFGGVLVEEQQPHSLEEISASPEMALTRRVIDAINTPLRIAQMNAMVPPEQEPLVPIQRNIPRSPQELEAQNIQQRQEAGITEKVEPPTYALERLRDPTKPWISLPRISPSPQVGTGPLANLVNAAESVVPAVYNTLVGIPEAMTSSVGLLSLPALAGGGVPARLAMGGFAADIAKSVPEQARRLGELSVTGTPQEKLESALNLGLSGALASGLGAGALRGKPLTERITDATKARQVEGGVPGERPGIDAQRTAPEAGIGDSLQRAKEVPAQEKGPARDEVLLRQTPSERAMTPEKVEPSPDMAPEELAQHQEVAQRLIDRTRSDGINVAIEESPPPEYSSDVMWTSPDGVVHVNTPRLQQWIKEIGGKNLEEWMQSGLTHESIHSNSLKFLENPAEAMRDYYSNATKAEKLLAERAYYRKFGNKEIDPFQMGAEMFRRDMERLMELKPTEVIQSKGLEWVKQKFIDVLERGIQRTRQALGTKASKAQRSILDKYQQKIDSVRKAKGWEAPAELRMEPAKEEKKSLEPNPPVGTTIKENLAQHRVEPPEQWREVLDKYGVSYGGKWEGMDLYNADLKDSGAGISWRGNTTPEQLAEKINAKRREFVEAEKKKASIEKPSETALRMEPKKESEILKDTLARLPKNILAETSIKGIKTNVDFPSTMEGSGAMLRNGYVLVEKGEPINPETILHEVIHDYVLKHPELYDENSFFGMEKAVDKIHSDILSSESSLRMEPKKERTPEDVQKRIDEIVRRNVGYTPKTAIQKIIETGTLDIPKGTEKPRGTAYEAMRAVYRAAQQAGAAGKRAGEIEKAAELKPVISELQDQISNSITKARGLAEYLRGQEKGGQLGYRVGKEEAQMVDKWLAADVENIRDSLTKLANQLPEKERGQFLPAITKALKRPELFKQGVLVGSKPIQGPVMPLPVVGKPVTTLGAAGGEMISPIENMYRNAAQVAARIDNRIEGVKRENLVKDIRDFDKFKDSQKVDVSFRQRIKGTLEAFEQLEKQGGLSMDALQTIHDQLVSLRDIGRSEQNVKDAIWQWQKEFAERHLQNQPTRPVETRPELRPLPGDDTPISMRIRNWIRNAQNKSSKLDKALLPIDALFDLMEDAKGLYTGWLFRHARGPIDLGYNNTIVRRNKLLAPLDNLIKNAKLTERNAQRIGVYAQNAQAGGRQRLIDSGLSPQTIDRIVASITPNEMAAYQMMRRAMDSQLPEVQRLMAKLYNTEVKPVDNYFPMPRDWRIFEDKPVEPTAPAVEAGYDELSSVRDLLSDYFPRQISKTKQGFTISRQPGAKTPIKIDAFDIFRQHIQDVSHLIEMQAELKRMGELGRGDMFREKYGDVGQKIFLDWLDTVARQGGVESFKRWKLLDSMRKNSSVGIIGFRLASQLVHESNVPYMIARIGNWFSTGLRESFTERGKKFVAENFAETQERGGSEPAQIESEREGGKLFGMKVIPASVIKASYAIARNLDRWNAQGGALGTYLRELKNKGLDWRNYDQLPIDRDAQAKALVLTRRAIASPAPKDVPQALSRGALTGGNVSVGRTLFQFQNIFLDQWSNIRHDLWQAGIREGNPKLAAQMLLAIVGATLAESGIKYGSKQAIGAVTEAISGNQPKNQEEEYGKKVLQEMVRRFPFGGQIESQLLYGETGIPALDAVTDISKAAKATFTATHPETRARSAVKTVTSAAQLAGIPGSSQLGELIYKSMPEPPKRRGQQLKSLKRLPSR